MENVSENALNSPPTTLKTLINARVTWQHGNTNTHFLISFIYYTNVITFDLLNMKIDLALKSVSRSLIFGKRSR